MLWAGSVGRNVRKVDFGLKHGRKLVLGPFGRFLEALKRQGVLGNVYSFLFFEFFDEIFDNPTVKVVASEVHIAAGCFHFHRSSAHLEHRNVVSAAAEIVDDYLFVLVLVQAVSQRGRRRFVDNPAHLETGNLTGIFGRLPLGIVEISRHGYHRFIYFLAERGFGIGFHLLQNHRRNFFRLVPPIGHLYFDAAGGRFFYFVRQIILVVNHFLVAPFPADQALHRRNRVCGINHRLPLGKKSGQTLARFRNGNDRRRSAGAFA